MYSSNSSSCKIKVAGKKKGGKKTHILNIVFLGFRFFFETILLKKRTLKANAAMILWRSILFTISVKILIVPRFIRDGYRLASYYLPTTLNAIIESPKNINCKKMSHLFKKIKWSAKSISNEFKPLEQYYN